MFLGQNLAKVHNRQLRAGWLGNLDTVEIMRRVAQERKSHPLVRELALSILHHHKVPSHDYVKEALAIGRYVKDKVRYVRDISGMEQLHDPVTMIEQLQRGVAQGDCDDMSLLIATLLLSIGHKPLYRMVRYKSQSGPFQHIYVVVYDSDYGQNKKRVALDAILKRKPMGTEVKHVSGQEVRI